MKKVLAPALTILIVAALAGVLYIRANVMRPESSVDEIVPSESASGASVRYVVRSTDGTVEIREFRIEDETTVTVDPSTVGLLWPARYTQSAFICATADEATAPTALRVLCDIGRDDALLLAAYDGDEKVVAANIDPRDLGITPGAAEGYLVPVAVADDKSAIYLGRRVETESWVAGLWKLDVATGEVSEISFVRTKDIYQYDINPYTKQLIGVTFSPPENLGEFPGGPAATYLINLATGEGRILSPADASVSENPLLSDDATMYATKWVASNQTFVNTFSPHTTVATIDGVMKDWFGDTVVFDRDGNLFLYDLKTSTETQMTHETDATVEYVGVAR